MEPDRTRGGGLVKVSKHPPPPPANLPILPRCTLSPHAITIYPALRNIRYIMRRCATMLHMGTLVSPGGKRKEERGKWGNGETDVRQCPKMSKRGKDVRAWAGITISSWWRVCEIAPPLHTATCRSRIATYWGAHTATCSFARSICSSANTTRCRKAMSIYSMKKR